MLTNALNTVGQYGMAGLGALGNVVDLPGSAARDLLAGKGLAGSFDQFATPFSDGNRTSGRELLRHYGMAGDENTWGNFAGGMAVEAATDPLNLIGGGWLKQAAKARATAMNANRGIDAANATSMSQRAAGFMPEETIKHLHPSVLGPDGMPKTFYHGTPYTFDKHELSRGVSESGYPDGIWNATDPEYANAYTSGVVDPSVPVVHPPGVTVAPNVRQSFIDARNPMNAQVAYSATDLPSSLSSHAGQTGGQIANSLPDGRHLKDYGFDSYVSKNPDSFIDGTDDILAAFSPSQMHLPYIAPALQQLQNVPGHATRTAAALAGHNALRTLRRRDER